jgi:hypothetical protein
MTEEFNLIAGREKVKQRVYGNNCPQGVKTKMLSLLMEVEEQDKTFIRLLKDNEDVIDQVGKWMNAYNEKKNKYPSYISIVLKCIELFESKIDKATGPKLTDIEPDITTDEAIERGK